MRKQVRKCIFETNSSSTHSIVVGNNGEDIYSGLPGVLEFHGGEFGWEHRLYTDTQTKADYLFTSLLYMDDPYVWMERIKEILGKWDVEAVFDELEEKQYSDGSVYYEVKGAFCYVDHGGGNIDFVKKVCDDEANLMNYLFSEGSYIETSNDNDDYEGLGEEPKNVLFEHIKWN